MGVLSALKALPQVRRNTSRFTEIVSVLMKYGLADWLGASGPGFVRDRLVGARGEKLTEVSRPERLCAAFQELGPTFVKLGQMLSTRPDLVGPEMAHTLEGLQGDTPPDPPDVVRRVVESELGRSLEECFAEFDLKPLGSASIGQVHRAVLHDGSKVAVKVQHDGIQEIIRNDMELLAVLAAAAEEADEELMLYQPVRIADDFERMLTRELDYNRERTSIETFTANFDGDETVHFTKTWPELSSKRVLTMEFLEGTSVKKHDELVAQGLDPAKIARDGANVWLKMILRDGFFHADPHPGNLLILEGGQVGILDCGMVGFIDESTQERFGELLMAFVSRDSAEIARQCLLIGRAPANLDREAFRADLNEFCQTHLSGDIAGIDFSAAIAEAVEVIRRHHVTIPGNFASLLRTIALLEGTSRSLDTNFQLIELLQPYRHKLLMRRMAPKAVLKRLFLTTRDWDRLLRSFPNDMMELMDRLRTSSLDVNLRHRDLDVVTNRVTWGILTAAVFLGSSILLGSRVPPLLWDTSIFGLIGTLGAGFLAVRLFWAIWRGGGLGH